MSHLILTILLSANAHAWESGTAPFCIVDNFGNLECYYYDLRSCKEALKTKFGDDNACVKR